jgi:hypothetical protein
MGAAGSAEVSVTIHQPAMCHVPDDLTLHQRWENFKSRTEWVLL